jgi:LuxR family maltose regulon positive regulatory protein
LTPRHSTASLQTGAASFESARALSRAAMCASGQQELMADAAYCVAQEPAWSSWHSTALWLLAEAHLLAGHLDEARALFAEASTAAARMSNWDDVTITEAQVARLAMDRGEWQKAADRLKLALGTIDTQRLHDYAFSLPAFTGAARLSLHHGDVKEAHRQLTRAMRARSSATCLLPYHAVRLRLQLARIYLAIADLVTARQLLREIDYILRHRPALGALTGEVDEFRRTLASSASTGADGRLPSPQPSYGCFPICRHISPPAGSPIGCLSPGTQSRPR